MTTKTVTGPFEEFRKFIERLRRLPGKVQRSLPSELGAASLKLVEEQFRSRTGPGGEPWKRTPDGGDLHRTGRLRAGVRLNMRSGGFSIVNTARSKGGSMFAGTHQYGRTVKGQMKWRGGDGRWHSSKKVRIPARRIVPRKNTLPPRWQSEFVRVTSSFFNRGMSK